MKVYFDVGAHDGRDGFGSLIGAKYQKCYAFEIDKRMIDKIKGSSKVWGGQYVLIEKAVGSKNETMRYTSFKKSNVGSLHEVDVNSIKGRDPRHFEIVDEYDVEVITLADFCKENNIECIDHLHIDTQGNDYEVILGLGDYINIVQSGELECYDTTQKNLYRNTTNTLENCKTYLEAAGFECSFERQSNHDGNLKFKRL